MAPDTSPATGGPEHAARLLQLVEECILAFELDGETGLENQLKDQGALAAAAREQIDLLQQSGLLRPPELPETIGPYRVQKRIGTGGMGTVFLAQQESPIHRRVAIKVIRPGMDSHEILARFAAEKKALALLNHPGIARILDAGSTDDGRPYLVMEHVAGVPIQRYCDERQLDTEQRLRLFLQVCDAVQHAHHKGIVHRDLKPSNILVMDRDGQPFPTVIDFGVAKSVGNPLANSGHLTVPGRMLGTPEYMSPEQATNEADVDTRTDVYSLGVVLFELLTGSLPFAGRTRRGRDLARVLREEEPATPSTRISTLGNSAGEIASLRRTTVGNLQRALQGDLDWIVLRALAKDANRRYGMPGELAADVRRHLQHEPVTAGPPGSWYRVMKFCARHRLQASAAAIVVVALGAGLVTSTVFYKNAAASSVSATESLDAALAAVEELVQVGSSDLVAVPHLESVRRNLLDRAVVFYRRFLAQEHQDARILPRTITAMVSLAKIQHELGDSEESVPLFQEAVSLLRSAAANDLDHTEQRRLQQGKLLCTAYAGIAMGLARTDQHAEGLEYARKSTEIARELLDLRPGKAALMRLANSLDREASFGDHTTREQQLVLLDEAIATADRVLTLTPDDPHAIAIMIKVTGDRSDALLDLGRPAEGLAAVEPMRALHAKVKDSGLWTLAQAMVDLASTAWRCGDGGLAIDVVDDVVGDLERFAANHPSVIVYRTTLVQLLNIRANAELDLRRFAAARATHTRILEECEAALRYDPDHLKLKRSLALACSNLVVVEQNWAGFGHPWDADAMVQLAKRGLAVLDSLPPHTTKGSRQPRMELLRGLGSALGALGRDTEAVEALSEAIALGEAMVAESGASSTTLKTRMSAVNRLYLAKLLDLRRFEEAGPKIDAAVAANEALRTAESMKSQWQSRHRALLLLLAQIRASIGDAAAMASALERHRALGSSLDWIGRIEAIGALTAAVAALPGDHGARAEICQRSFTEVYNARDAVQKNGEKGTSPGTLAVMRYRTEMASLGLADAVGEPDGTRAAAAAAIDAAAALRDASPGDRSDGRVVAAAVAATSVLARAGAAAAAEAEMARLGTLLADAPGLLADAAERCCVGATKRPERQQLYEDLALAFLRQALARGFAAKLLAADRFAQLRARPDFRTLQQ